ncbi:hypothetical protein GH714_031408 [Hevea brasiliensis]|uniref:Dolichyl-diphosphooligosaccharide--protein glycosyltransferase subunit 1 n=1 Tax=Hevea brasiliensis TaxID=3981 RepID=A0A6A6L1A9_HEVBR|nr:hypothetical protein GH714_031408 [Hevea brasiliensis]
MHIVRGQLQGTTRTQPWKLRGARLTLALSIFAFLSLLTTAFSQQIQILNAERRVDLTSHIVKVFSTLKVENTGTAPATEILLAFPPTQVDHLAVVKAQAATGKRKKQTYVPLDVKPTELPDAPNGTKYFIISLLSPLNSELKYGPYEDRPPYSFSPIIVHFENNNPFAVVEEIVREVEISHWGNLQITEHYKLVHTGARHKGVFSRVDYQSRPSFSGVSSFKHLLARLPPRVHSVYYRDEIGNISSSHLRTDNRKSELEIEPRYPLFGGWKATFVIEAVLLQVVLPEGSKDPSAVVPFSVEQRLETKYSYLDVVGRTVLVLEKKNLVPEHNSPFQFAIKTMI